MSWFLVRASVSELQLCNWLTRRWYPTVESLALCGPGQGSLTCLASPSSCAHALTHVRMLCICGERLLPSRGLFCGTLFRENGCRGLCQGLLPSCPPFPGEFPHHLLQGALQGAALHSAIWQVSLCLRNHGTPTDLMHCPSHLYKSEPWPSHS